jgi:DNA-binding transcriptional regulator YdaS (Cro superfamily)
MNNLLSAWQKSNGVPNKALAAMVGVHASLITHINKGRRKPSAPLALRIDEATKGAVPFRSWYEESTNGGRSGL